MNNKTKLITAIVILILIIGGIWYYKQQKTSPKNDGPITLGLIAPLTGTGASYGTEGRNAAVLAIEQINQAGGINGQPIKLIEEDGKCDAKEAVSAWQKLTTVDKVSIVLGGHCSSETLAIAPLAKEAKVLVLADMTSASVIPSEGEYLFRNNPASSYYAKKTGEFLLTKNYKNIAMVTEIKDYSTDYANNLKQAFTTGGGKVIVDESFNPGTTDFRTILAKLKTAKVDAIVLSAQGPDTLGLLAKQINALGLTQPLAFSSSFSSKKFLEASGGYIPKNFIVVNLYTDKEDPLTKKFLTDYEQKFGQPVTFNTYLVASVYDMVFRLKPALEKCPASDVECLRAVISKQTDWTGAAGKITFQNGSNPMTPLGTLSIGSDGKDVYTLIK